ncbi:hypothetical protein [Nakamurella sp.]|uniref:hypothetical protein n=1 Tax=Nakamurella sp. TaxID=1869182 RepID=UPI003B3AD2C2
MTEVQEHHAQLRAWAEGLYGLEAATELLIRGFNGRFADPGCPWVHPTASGHWIDFDSIPSLTGALSGGERRFLQITAALDDGVTTVNLGRCLAGLDRQHVHLVLAAVAHTAGTHQHQQLTVRHDGGLTVDRPGPMSRWDQAPPPPETPSREGGIGR